MFQEQALHYNGAGGGVLSTLLLKCCYCVEGKERSIEQKTKKREYKNTALCMCRRDGISWSPVFSSRIVYHFIANRLQIKTPLKITLGTDSRRQFTACKEAGLKLHRVFYMKYGSA